MNRWQKSFPGENPCLLMDEFKSMDFQKNFYMGSHVDGSG